MSSTHLPGRGRSGGRTRHPPRALGIVAVVAGALVVTLDAADHVAAQDTANNSLQSISPPDGATLTESPTEIVLSFNQELANDQRPVVTLGCGQFPQQLEEPEYDDENLVVTFALVAPVPRGSCTISWQLQDEGGATLLGPEATTFSVDADPPPTTTTLPGAGGATTTTLPVALITPGQDVGPASTPIEGSNSWALWFGRVLSTLGILAVFGGLILIALGWPEGPEYIVTVRYLRAVWVLAMLGTIVFVIAFTAQHNGSSFGAAMSPGNWLDLADAGWPGRGALLRLVLVAGTGAFAMRPERIIDPTTAMWAWGVPGAAVLAVALSRVEGPAAPLGVLLGFVHLLGAAAWFGGAALVAKVVLAGPGEEDLLHATRAYSRISGKAMLVTVAAGVVQMVRLVGSPFGSSHGRVLLIKVVAVAAMVLVGVAARQQVALRLDRAQEMTASLADRFRRAFGAEAAIGAVVMAFSGWMLALTPANVDRLAGERYLDTPLVFSDPALQLEARLFIGPAQVGLNGFRLEVETPQEGISQLVVRFFPPIESNQRWIEQPLRLTTAGTVVRPRDNGIPFNVPGVWTVELAATTVAGTQPGLRGTFVVASGEGATSPAASTTTLAPAPVQVSVVQQSTTTAAFATTTTAAPTTSTTLP